MGCLVFDVKLLSKQCCYSLKLVVIECLVSGVIGVLLSHVISPCHHHHATITIPPSPYHHHHITIIITIHHTIITISPYYHHHITIPPSPYHHTTITITSTHMCSILFQRTVQESGEKGRGDEKLQQTIQLTMKRLETFLRVRVVMRVEPVMMVHVCMMV